MSKVGDFFKNNKSEIWKAIDMISTVALVAEVIVGLAPIALPQLVTKVNPVNIARVSRVLGKMRIVRRALGK